VNTDRPATVGELSAWAAARYGDTIAVRGAGHELSYVELDEAVRETAAGLAGLGVRAGDHVALLAETRPEWTICDLAIAVLGAVCVPVYPTNSADECAWVLGDSLATMVICENQSHVDRISSVRDSLPALATVVSIDELPGVPSLAELRKQGGDVPATVVAPGSPNTIVYTSGTTGPPKGCLLSHTNWRTSLDAIEQVTTLGPGDVIYVYLPLAHLFARMVQLTTFECGATLHYFGGDIRDVVTELTSVRPTHLPSVPRLFEKVYRMVLATAAGAEADGEQKVTAAVEVGLRVRHARHRGEPVSDVDAEAFARADERLFSLVRNAFGGRVREALTGAAPIAAEILEFFYACGVPIYEAYGMTESCALISANVPGSVRFGTVGQVLPGIEARIAEDGEVLARGRNVFGGYLNNPAGTDEMIGDGWLHTGDLGVLDDEGFLTINGRKKDIIITAGGKNLTPANLENDLRQSRWISHAVMIGDRRPYPVALIALDPDEITAWATARDLPPDPAALAEHPDVHDMIRAEVDRANGKYAPPERIRRFAVLGRDFSQETGELTPTLKIRRAVVGELYADVIDTLYP
jgi:long-chain acyl-CoA synthetase